MQCLRARSHLPGPARILGALALLALLGACGIGRGPLFRAPPLEHRRPAPPPLPDEAETPAATESMQQDATPFDMKTNIGSLADDALDDASLSDESLSEAERELVSAEDSTFGATATEDFLLDPEPEK